MRRGEIWWADLGPHRRLEQTGRRPVIVWQGKSLLKALQTVLIVPLTTNLSRANLAGTALISAYPEGPPSDSVALAFQLRAVPRDALTSRVRMLTEVELAELELATDEALGRVEPDALGIED